MSDWRDEAKCKGLGDLMFPTGTGAQALLEIERAKQVCHSCPIERECGEYALDPETHQEYGIWGGMDEEERRRILRRVKAS